MTVKTFPKVMHTSQLLYLVVLKQLQEEGSHCGRDADKEVDDDEEHVRRARHFEPERGRVHDGCDRPTRAKK